jgi:anaerobic magnesium-protoporphyrin IX monomethyl ester cyclase
MKVLLTTLNAKYIHVNLAIRLLYQLNKDKEGLAWKEFTIKENPDEIANYCKDFDVVAFSCYIWNITPTLAVLKRIKALNPDCKILLGGPEVSYEYNDVIALPEVDYIIAGEGEAAFKAFLENYPAPELVPNLIYKTPEGIQINKSAPQFDVANFEYIAPYSDDAPETLKNRVLYIETSRGCPYKCEFCLASLDNKVRYLPDVHIKSTLLYLMQHGKVIKFLDRTFNIKKDFTLDIFRFILEHHRPENVFQFEITADILHPDIIAFINKEVPKGLFRFEIGIQTVNQKANLEVSRKQNFEKTKKIIQSVYSKVEMHLDLIVGLPLDYLADIKYSFERVFELFPPELQLGFLKFLKGTPVREKYEQYGFEYDPMPPYQLIRSNFLSAHELETIVALEHALEIYWNKKRAINTLKYVSVTYGSFDFLMGLGIYFGTQRDYHKFSLDDVFVIANDFVTKNYPTDAILRELLAIDYYLHHKVKPKPLLMSGLEGKEKNAFIENHHLNHHKYRFVVLPVSFNTEAFVKYAFVKYENDFAVIQFNGQTKADWLCRESDVSDNPTNNKSYTHSLLA